MSHQPSIVELTPPAVFTLNVQSMDLTDEQFEKLCRENPELRLELTSRGELIIMPPAGMKTGWRNSKLTQRLAEWTETDGSGLSFDSSTLITLPDGSKRSPDASWIRHEKWEPLSDDQKEGSPHMALDSLEKLDNPPTLAGDPILPGFTFTVQEIW